MLTELERKILAGIELNAERPATELARSLGISLTGCGKVGVVFFSLLRALGRRTSQQGPRFTCPGIDLRS